VGGVCTGYRVCSRCGGGINHTGAAFMCIKQTLCDVGDLSLRDLSQCAS